MTVGLNLEPVLGLNRYLPPPIIVVVVDMVFSGVDRLLLTVCF
jgi:hypothetical protein